VGEDVIESTILANDDDHVFDLRQRRAIAGMDQRRNGRGRHQNGGDTGHGEVAFRTARVQSKHAFTPLLDLGRSGP
jgi:hypothetical protein